MKFPVVAGVAACHPPTVLTSVSGLLEVTWGTLKCRMRGLFDAAISLSLSFDAATVHSIFDCPEQNQTSPTNTSFSSTLLFPVTVSLVPVLLAFSGVSDTAHLPSFATVSAFWPANETVTFSPSDAKPQTGTFCSR